LTNCKEDTVFPKAITVDIYNITPTSDSREGKISNIYNADFEHHGACWGTTPNLTVEINRHARLNVFKINA